MAAADIALYDAKASGRGRAVVYRGGVSRTVRGVAAIKDAVAAGRLVVHAQPIIDLGSGRVVQHELLVRMLDEDGRLVAPGQFIPIAERFGLIGQIDHWVLHRAVELARQGRSVAVNISAHTLNDPAVLELVEREIRAGLSPANLGFEITETAALFDLGAARSFAERLTRLGFDIALDDFGTGFGSLLHLKQLPVTAIKIDIEFVRTLTGDAADRQTVRALVEIAHARGHMTVAEGVEDAETLELLRTLGVDRAQGYHIGRPAPIAAPGD